MIAAWLVAVVGLGVVGLGLDDKLSTKAIFVDGSETARQHELVGREFGDDNALFVLLSGSPDAIERQGRELEQGLQGLPQTSVNTPWQRGGAIEGLRPAPDRLALLVVVRRSPGQTYSDLIAPVRREIDATVGDSVKVSLAGAPILAESFRDASTEAVAAGEKIALPLLLIILLVVFRSVLAAAIPVLVGGAVVAMSRGFLTLLADSVRIDALALAGVGMMGLALGVDYALLIVSRFREELEKCDDVGEAARVTVSATGRSVVPAGCGLLLAMAVASLTLPGPVVKSVALAISTASVLSVVSALVVVPAILTLLGRRLDRWALPSRSRKRAASVHWSQRLSRRPVLALPIVALLVLSAAWASTLDSEVGAVAQLPAEDPGRVQLEEVQDALGPGWVAPLEVLVAGRGAPVTTETRLRAMAGFQRQVEAEPGVAAMSGLAPLERRLRPLGNFEESLAAQRRGLDRLGDGIGRARDGSAAGTAGLVRAVDGARTLGSSLGESEAGAGLLAEGARNASEGSAQLSAGLGRASDGSGELARGTRESSDGAGRLTDGIDKAAEGSGQVVNSAEILEDTLGSGSEWLKSVQGPLQSTESELESARAALERMGVGKGDPEYAAAVGAVNSASRSLTGVDPASGELVDPSYEGVAAGVTHAENQFSAGTYLAGQIGKNGQQGQEGLEKLARNSARLDRGLQRLSGASEEVSAAIERLSQGGAELSPALLRLSRGSEHLAGGLGSLQGGAEALAGGLDDGARGSRSLTEALGRIDAGLSDQQEDASTPGGSPGLFRSGYFYLAGLDGAGRAGRDQAALMVNVDQGGSAARMMVIPDHDPDDREATEHLTERLRDDAGALARQTGTEVVVGGEGPNMVDVDSMLRDSAPGARLALCLVTLLVLIPVTRSLLLPLIAALLNLLTVSATFGLLSLLFNDSLLGGPGYVDTVVIPATIMVIFGLAIDYEVFLFARIREEYLRTGSTAEAIASGLGSTAHVITGAAFIMITVFLAFSLSPFATLRNFGVAQAIAVAIDAFAIRLVVLPVAMRALGERCWWIPGWLDRMLPGEGRPAPAAAEAPA